jgi:hypothetical protein
VLAVAVPERNRISQTVLSRLPGLSHRLQGSLNSLNLVAAGLLQQLLVLLSHLPELLQLLDHRRHQ